MKSRFFCIAAFATLGACTAGPDYHAPSASSLGVPSGLPSQPSTSAGAEILSRWWDRFDDPLLSSLVDRSLATNLDIAAATARLREAEAQVAGARAGWLPQISGGGNISRTFGQDEALGGDTVSAQPTFSASWEFDLAGGIRRSVEATQANADNRLARLRSVRLAIGGEVARRYVEVRLAQNRLRVNEDNLASLAETVQITRWRAQAGLVSSLDVEQAVQLQTQTAAGLPALRLDYRTAANRLSVLVATAPGAVDSEFAVVSPIPETQGAIPSLIPLDIVRRRPDIAEAERTLAAETARIGVQIARLYPSLTLTGSLGPTSTDFSGLVDTLMGTIGANINQLLFDGGQTRADIRAQEATRDAALADYRQAVLEALEDADNRYEGVTSASARLESWRASEAAARNALVFQRIQYRAGLIAFTSLLDAERTLLSSSDSRVQAEADLALAQISLFQALGGDETPASPTFIAAGTNE